jgi:hypothetical protein
MKDNQDSSCLGPLLSTFSTSTPVSTFHSLSSVLSLCLVPLVGVQHLLQELKVFLEFG